MNNALMGWSYGPTPKKTPVDPYADLPSLAWDVPDYRAGPLTDLNALASKWQASMPNNGVDLNAGRVPQFAAPNALAPSMDRQSANMVAPSMWDFSLESLKMPFTKRIDTVTKFLPHLAKSYFGPTVTMQDISAMLPKDQVPWMGSMR